MTNYDFNVSLSNPKDQELICEFEKEMNFSIKQKGGKSDRYRALIKLLKSPAIMVSGATTLFLSDNPDELCDRLSLLLQQKQAGNNS